VSKTVVINVYSKLACKVNGYFNAISSITVLSELGLSYYQPVQ